MGTAKRERQKANRAAKLAADRAEQQATVRKSRTKRLVILGAVVVAVLVIAWLLVRDGGDGDDDPVDAPAALVFPDAGESSDTTECPADDGSSPRVTTFEGNWIDADLPFCIDLDASYQARITTSEGDIVFDLDPVTYPESTNAFVVLSRYHYYDGAPISATNPRQGFVRLGLPAADAQLPFDVPFDEGGTDAEAGLVLWSTDGNGFQDGSIDFLVGDVGAYEGTGVPIGTLSGDGRAVVSRILGLHQQGVGATAAATGSGAPAQAINIQSIEITES